MKVTINKGHGPLNSGGYDPGAVGPGGLKEATETNEVGERLAAKLKKCGVETLVIQDGDLGDITQHSNNWGAQYFISVHCNSATDPAAHGTETYALSPGGQGEKLARTIQAELVRATGLTDRGVKFANYYVLRKTNCPAVLVEIAFISNPREEALMKDSSWDDKVAAAIAKGFCRFAGIEYRADQPTTPPATPPPANTVMYRVIIDDRQIMALSSLANAKSEVSTRIDAGQGKVGKVQRNTDGFIEFTYSKQPALDYERELLRVAANGVQVIALTGYSKCVAYAKANLAGKHVTLECIKDGRKWDLGVIPSLPTPGTGNDHGNLTAIVGISEASVNQLERLMHQRNTGAEYLAHIYARMEKIYQIRADIAFCQMIKETRSLMFGGDVTPEQHNPAGIGATGEGSKGATFESWDKGIEAQFQHLWAYATNKPLPVGRFKIDPRFDLVKRGAAPYVEWLGQADNPNGVGWAVPGKGYGASITALIQEAKKMSDLPLPGQTGPSKLRNGVFRLIWRQLKRLVMKLWGLFKNKQ